MTDRDTFAAAALTGLIASQPTLSAPNICRMSFNWADLMLRERERTDHDAAPAARADLPDERPLNAVSASGGTPSAASRDGSGTGDTPEQSRFNAAVMQWISEATSAAYWSSDGGRKIMADACVQCWNAFCPKDHDAAPAATASEATASPERVRVRGDAGTGDTQEPTARVAVPVAWAAVATNGQPLWLAYSRADAEGAVVGMADVVPLYRSPTLTDAEAETLRELRDEAAQYADEIGLCASEVRGRQRIIDGLLVRLGGER